MDQPLNLFLELVTVFGIVPFDSMEVSPYSQFMTHYICLIIWRHKDVMHVKNLAPNLFTESVHRREVLSRPTYSLECSLDFYRRCIITLPLAV